LRTRDSLAVGKGKTCGLMFQNGTLLNTISEGADYTGRQTPAWRRKSLRFNAFSRFDFSTHRRTFAKLFLANFL
jgi:hypothetical protein